MGFTAKSNSKNTKSWDMGLLLVFFPEDNNPKTTSIVDKSKLFSSSSSSSSSIRRSSSNLLLTKAQSTIYICALLLFITLLLFTLSTFEPTTKIHYPIGSTTPRRFLSQNPRKSLLSNFYWFGKMWKHKSNNMNKKKSNVSSNALQGMGTLFRRGTRAMNDLVVGHLVEDVKDEELQLFLRVLHRCGLTSKSDVILISASNISRFGEIIQLENDSFLKLIAHYYRQLNRTGNHRPRPNLGSFDVTQFVKMGKKEFAEPLWGKRVRSNFSNSNVIEVDSESTSFTQLSYGSVLGFEASELDPENSLSGFLDNIPLSLRRWACYQLLLGRVRRNFKHVMLVDVKSLLILGDPFGRVGNWSPESVMVFTKSETSSGKRGKNSVKTHSSPLVNSGIIVGGARGVRRLSNAMLTQIVRTTVQYRKNSVTELEVLNKVVSNEFVTKSVNLIKSTESVPELSSAIIGKFNSVAIYSGSSNNHDLNSIIMKQICLSEIDSSAYRDC